MEQENPSQRPSLASLEYPSHIGENCHWLLLSLLLSCRRAEGLLYRLSRSVGGQLVSPKKKNQDAPAGEADISIFFWIFEFLTTPN